MFSFDISVIDIALIIAIMVLFALYLTRISKENYTQKPLSRIRKPQTQPKDNQTKKPNCPHNLGYLNTRKEKHIPEECTQCTELVQCLLPQE